MQGERPMAGWLVEPTHSLAHFLYPSSYGCIVGTHMCAAAEAAAAAANTRTRCAECTNQQ